MEKLQNGDNTQRVISNDKLIEDDVPKLMPLKKKLFIGGAIFTVIGLIVGIALGLYFHFRPSATPIQTTVSQTSDGTVHSSTKFIYTDNNLFGQSANQTFTIMFAGVNQSDTRRRMLQVAEGQNLHVDTTLHYTHQSGIQIKFRGNQVLNISVPIDQLVEYISQQEGSQFVRLLEEELTQYQHEGTNINGSDVYDAYRGQILSAVQDILPNTSGDNIHMSDSEIYELKYDQNSATYKYVNTTSAMTKRRLFSFGSLFHKIGGFFSNVAKKVVNFVKKDGPTILKYGAIGALAGIDIVAKGPSGISDAVKMFKSGNVLTAVELAAEGVATRLPPYIGLPIEFLGKACFSNPPRMHCTKKGAIKAAEYVAEEVIIDQLKKRALSTIFSLAQ